MPRISPNPIKQIVSFRVNDEEKAFLERLAKQKGLNLSNYLRRVLALLEEPSSRAEQLREWI